MLKGLKLLLVEDDEDDYLITRDLLEELHPGQVDIEWVTSAAVALEILAQDRHDLCLVDYRLGMEDGLQLLNAASEADVTIPLIMLTGQHDSEVDAQAQKAGAVDYLVKSELSPALFARAIRYATARREAEEERVQRRRAEAENRAKSQFLAQFSHELRTPLTSIIGYSELLLSQESDVEKTQNLRVIDRNGKYLLNLLNDVLDLSKIEAGKLDLDLCAVNVETCLADLQSLLAVQAREKRVQLNFSAQAPIPETIQTDPVRLRQVLLNLLGNAIKFTQDGRVELRVSVVHGLDSNASAMQFEVVDTGTGISEADQQRIFEPYSQASDSHSAMGFGLGLSISQNLANKLGGAIECRSQLGGGSTFTLTIDAGDLSDVPCKPLDVAKYIGQPASRQQFSLHGNVLVVDDLADIRDLLGKFLRECGLEVTLAANGEEAVNMVMQRRGKPDQFTAIVMDLQMPVMDGFAALQLMRGNGYSGPVVALTASTMRGERDRCLSAGFTEYLGKPVNIDHLLGTLARYLRAGADHAAAAPSLPGSSTSGSVLLVEDDADARQALSRLIAHLGWDVVCAANGRQALDEVAAAAPQADPAFDVVLLDLGLPDMDGYELAARLRAGPLAGGRIVALSGSSADPERARLSGFDQHALKPISLQQLEQLLSFSR